MVCEFSTHIVTRFILLQLSSQQGTFHYMIFGCSLQRIISCYPHGIFCVSNLCHVCACCGVWFGYTKCMKPFLYMPPLSLLFCLRMQCTTSGLVVPWCCSWIDGVNQLPKLCLCRVSTSVDTHWLRCMASLLANLRKFAYLSNAEFFLNISSILLFHQLLVYIWKCVKLIFDHCTTSQLK